MKIEHLQIRTRQLERQLEFYREVLQQEVTRTTAESFTVKMGYTTLECVADRSATPYHIAFRIGAHLERSALKWLKDRVAILPDGDQEVVDFQSWNAKSIYFHDADQNVLELISRGHLHPTEAAEFDGTLMGIAEIGLATTEVEAIFRRLNKTLGLEKFTGNYHTFCATGDDQGLLIIINYTRKDWFPIDQPAHPSAFKLRISTATGQTSAIIYDGEELEVKQIKQS